MRILIIGGAGSIGRFLDEALTKNGFKVDILTRNFLYKYNDRAISTDYASAFKSQKKDLNLNNYEVLIYLAWGTKPSTAYESPKKDLTDSLLCGVEILDKISLLKSKPTFIFISSGGAVYGEINRPCIEDDQLNPINPYGIAKACFEKYLQFYSLCHKVPIIILWRFIPITAK
jgi:UDP-glucose 4-epimerase